MDTENRAAAAASDDHPAPPNIAEEPATDGGAAATMRWRWPDALIGIAYAGAAVAVTGRMWIAPTQRTPLVNGDETFFEWMFVHALRVLTVGESPLRSPQLNAPLGVNLMANTNVLGLAIPMAPLTAWLGPSVVFVLLLTIGLSGTAFAWYYVMSRHFVGDRLAALVGGAICGFGPGIIAHATGHPNLTAQFVLPLIVWRALALRDSRHLIRDGAVLGALAAYQAFINEELLLLTALALAVFAAAYLASRPSLIRTTAGPMLAGLGIATLVAGAALAYPLRYQFTGPGHVSGLPRFEENLPYRLPLVSYVTLPRLSLWGDAVGNRLLTRPTEENSFLGWPVVVLSLVIVAVMWRRRPVVRALFVVAVVFAYASLGNSVTISDVNRSYNQSLWRHLSGLPVFNSMLPSRLGLVVLPVVGLLCAFGVAAAHRSLNSTGGAQVRREQVWVHQSRLNQARIGRAGGVTFRMRARWLEKPEATGRHQAIANLRRATAITCLAAIAAALVTIVPRQIDTVTREPVPTFFTSSGWRRYVPEGFTVLPASPGPSSTRMRWSVSAGLNFGVPGGYFFGPDQTGRARYGPVPRPTTALLAAAARGKVIGRITPALAEQVVADLRYWHVAIIVLTPHDAHAADLYATLDKLLGPGQHVKDIWLWNVLPITAETELDRAASPPV